jgi:small-conductance mechanosensitive channel
VLVGWVLGRLIGVGLRTLLRAAGFNEGVRRLAGEDARLRHEPAALAGWAVQWFIVLLTVMLAADVLGFDLSRSVTERLAELLPRVTAATIVLIVGIALAMGLGAGTRRLFDSAGFRGAELRGRIVTVTLSAFAVLLALEQLGLAAQFIVALAVTALASAGLALALAFGLGCRDLVRDFVVEMLRSLDDDTPQRPR